MKPVLNFVLIFDGKVWILREIQILYRSMNALYELVESAAQNFRQKHVVGVAPMANLVAVSGVAIDAVEINRHLSKRVQSGIVKQGQQQNNE